MSSTDNTTNMLLIFVAIQLLMFIIGQGIVNLVGYNPLQSNNILSAYDNGNYTLPSNPSAQLPSGEGTTLSVDTGLSYTDPITTNKEWWLNVPGLGFVQAFFSGPAVLLAIAGFPPALAWAIATCWYILCVFVLVGYVLGK